MGDYCTTECVVYILRFFCVFLKPTLCFIKFTSASNLISPRLLMPTSSFWVIVGPLIKWNPFLLMLDCRNPWKSNREGFQMCSLHLFWRRANAWNVSFETLYGGQFTLSTQFIILNYPVTLYHRHNTTVSLETYFPSRVSKAYICQFLRRLKVGVQRENVVS